MSVGWCLTCEREATRRRQAANPEKFREKARKADRRWREANPEKVREVKRRCREANPEHYAAYGGYYMAIKRGATLPEGATLSGIIASTTPIYAEARRLSKETGIPHHVDHIVPIKHGGLHCPTNLQVLTRAANLKKGASWIDDSLEADAEHWERVEEVMKVLDIDELAAEDWVFQNDFESLYERHPEPSFAR